MNEHANIPAAEMAEGPYYGHGGPIRSDIRDGRPGKPMNLSIQIVNAATGEPVEGAKVDIWHSDATGHYSGYDFDPDQQPQSVVTEMPTKPEIFLRGAQITDQDGRVEFKTIFPGWYASRTPHIHVKVFNDEKCVLTTQLFLPEAGTNTIYAEPEYERNVSQDTFNRTDTVIALTPDSVAGCWVNLELDGEGVRAAGTLAVDPAAESVQFDPPADFKPPLGGIEHQQDVR